MRFASDISLVKGDLGLCPMGHLNVVWSTSLSLCLFLSISPSLLF